MKLFQTGSTIPIPIQSEQKVHQSSFVNSRSAVSACDIFFDPKKEILHFSTLKTKSS